MRPVEVRLTEQVDHREHQHAVHGVGAELHPRQDPVGIRPQADRLERGPDGDAARQAPEHVVPGLVSEQELAVAAGRKAGVELEAVALRLEHIQPQVQRSRDQHQQRRVAQVQFGDPADPESAHARHVRGQEQPTHHRQADVDQRLPAENALEAEHDVERPLDAPRTRERWRRLGQILGNPLAAPVARKRSCAVSHAVRPPSWCGGRRIRACLTAAEYRCQTVQDSSNSTKLIDRAARHCAPSRRSPFDTVRRTRSHLPET